ncbi:C-22 sterol desaturase [Sugiyamaella lignohabitans]|uniref:C-22 sterol desaturase ERG5 n=1 Tax=Sugiyamaella lignohabitans TaxID=796027 RepID=A0A161HGF0_9ASCO|nr:C-22 sterol desaturase [Sugiyamaella lignohabitans]ANB11851.1 C-22 sterol desaturase [Sugiyamaella lignohabitans]
MSVENASVFTDQLPLDADNLSQSLTSSLIVQAIVWSRSNVWSLVLTVVVGLLIYDQISYIIKKGSIAGPKFKVWPVIGPFLESMNPKFEEYKAKWDSGPLSCVSVFHKFVVIASNRDLARKIFNSPSYVKPCVVDVAIKLLRPTNWVFLDGKAHVDYRRSLNGLFTRQALGVYLPHQETIYDKYFERFVALSKSNKGPLPFMPEFRELNCAVSLRTFCGEYITEEQVKIISDNYYKITAALELVNFPIILPFTKTWYGKKITDMTMDIFAKCAQMAKDHIAQGGDVTCVMDAWVKLMHDSKNSTSDDNDEVKKFLVRDFTNKEISETIFTFLFASQDASSSATTWLFQIIADRPDVMAKIREEQLRVRDGDVHRRLDVDLVESMEYTRMVVKEALRYRPPVTMVPYVAKKSYPISADYTIPKGAMVIPTLYPALHDPEVYENPDEFIPERWVANSPATNAAKNWLVFGTGPHVCLGQTYVMLNLTAMMGKAALFYDWKHTVTEKSENIRVFATIFPDDDCILEFSKRADPTKL